MKTKRASDARGRELCGCSAPHGAPQAARSALLNQPWHATYLQATCWFSAGAGPVGGDLGVAEQRSG